MRRSTYQRTRNIGRFACFVAAMLYLLAACSAGEARQPQASAIVNTGDATMATVTGEVFYRERIALAPGAELVVKLEDISRMDVAATLLGEVRYTLDKAPPYSFELPYDPSDIDSRMRYGVRAQIFAGDRLMFSSSQAIDPFAGGAQPLRIMLSVVGSAPASNHTAPADDSAVVSVDPLATLHNTHWKLTSIGDRAVAMGELQEKAAYMKLTPKDSRVQGYGGCNQFNGSYVVTGNDLRFGPIAATRRACQEGMDTEQGFFAILDKAAHYSIHKHSMTLFSAQKKPLGTFEAIYF